MSDQTVSVDYRVIRTAGGRRTRLLDERVGMPVKQVGLQMAFDLSASTPARSVGPVKEFIVVAADGPFVMETSQKDAATGTITVQRSTHNRLFMTYGAYESVAFAYAPRQALTDRPYTSLNVIIS